MEKIKLTSEYTIKELEEIIRKAKTKEGVEYWDNRAIMHPREDIKIYYYLEFGTRKEDKKKGWTVCSIEFNMSKDFIENWIGESDHVFDNERDAILEAEVRNTRLRLLREISKMDAGKDDSELVYSVFWNYEENRREYQFHNPDYRITEQTQMSHETMKYMLQDISEKDFWRFLGIKWDNEK